MIALSPLERKTITTILDKRVPGVPRSVFGSRAVGKAKRFSDLDLLLRAERPLPRSEARPLLQLLESRACRIDLQLETPLGGVALREWAGDGARVLVKTADGPRLVGDPWQAERAA